MRKCLRRKIECFIMATTIAVSSCVCIPNMKVKAEKPVATVTDADGNIGDNQPEEITDDLDLIDTETTDESEVVDTEVEATKIPIDSAHFPKAGFIEYMGERSE